MVKLVLFKILAMVQRCTTLVVHSSDLALLVSGKEGVFKTIDVWKEMMHECPDAVKTSFKFQWDSRLSLTPPFDSATSLHDIRFWQ